MLGGLSRTGPFQLATQKLAEPRGRLKGQRWKDSAAGALRLQVAAPPGKATRAWTDLPPLIPPVFLSLFPRCTSQPKLLTSLESHSYPPTPHGGGQVTVLINLMELSSRETECSQGRGCALLESRNSFCLAHDVSPVTRRVPGP